MTATVNSRVLFNSYPKGYPIPGETVVVDRTETIDLDKIPINGGVLLKLLAVSIDPYQRGKMRQPSKTGYSASYVPGEPIYNFAVARVLRSESQQFKTGSIVQGVLKFQEYVVVADVQQLDAIENKPTLPASTYLGAAGMPGKTAFYGWRSFITKKLDSLDRQATLYVSTAAGAVGSLVVQFARQAGVKVIASAGSDEKVDFLKTIRADVAFNYKTTNTKQVLQENGPIDIYWDHVGGDMLDDTLENMEVHGIVIVCGMISQYNSQPVPIKVEVNMRSVLEKTLTIYGLLVMRLESKELKQTFYEQIPRDIADGRLKFVEHKYKGIESVGQALYEQQTGQNKGKTVVNFSDHDE